MGTRMNGQEWLGENMFDLALMVENKRRDWQIDLLLCHVHKNMHL